MEFHQKIILLLVLTLVVIVLGFSAAAILSSDFRREGWSIVGAVCGPLTGAITLIVTTYAVRNTQGEKKDKDDDVVVDPDGGREGGG